LDLFQEELPHLLPLPEKPYDTAEVVYRTVNPEGYVLFFCSTSINFEKKLPV